MILSENSPNRINLFGFLVIILTGLFNFSALYSPQPLYPVLSSHFNVSSAKILLLQTVVFIPLCIAPIFYGKIIGRFHPKFVLSYGFIALGCFQILFCFSDNFEILLAARFMQGLFIPAVMTAVLSYISVSVRQNRIQTYISYYMASTMAGGVLGRIVSGLSADNFAWWSGFIFLGAGSIFTGGLAFFLNVAGDKNMPASKNAGYIKAIKDKRVLYPILAGMAGFFMFSSVMNSLSLRLKELSSELSSFSISLSYIGSLAGAVTSSLLPRLLKKYDNTWVIMIFSFILMSLSVFIMTLHVISVNIGAMFIFCGMFIIIHSLAAGSVNKVSGYGKGELNGLYFSMYYSAGALGSFAPGIVYIRYSWFIFAVFLSFVAFTGSIVAFRGIKN